MEKLKGSENPEDALASLENENPNSAASSSDSSTTEELILIDGTAGGGAADKHPTK